MSVTVELWGGPCDGLVIAIPEMAPRLHFPIADFDTRADEDGTSPPRPSISKVEYIPAGRLRAGRQVYRVNHR